METQLNKHPIQETETQMDEFEITSKTTKNNHKNMLKQMKIAALIVMILFLSATVLITINMLSQGQKQQYQEAPTSAIVPTNTPTMTPQIKYPKEFTIIESKIEAYEKEVIKAQSQNERNKLNYPIMTINFSF